MKLLLELSMECESLARSEAVSVGRLLGSRSDVLAHEKGVLVLDTDADPLAFANRMALCHSVSEHLCSCQPEDVEAASSSIDIPGPVRVHSTRIGTSHEGVNLDQVNRSVGAIFRQSVGVDIHRPTSELRVVYSEGAHLGRLIGLIDRAGYERRKTRNMPFDHPVSIHPKFARCLVNLTEARSGTRVLDPFCGTGAIVTEAALAGNDAIGSDVSERMIEGARSNMASAGAKGMLHLCDVGSITKLVHRVDGVATDPPYGRSSSTNGEPVSGLLLRAMKSVAQVLDRGSRMAIVVHDSSLIADSGDFELLESHDLWVHRSLTRHFQILRRR